MRLNILLCSDHPHVLETISSVIRQEGHCLKVCRRGMEAVQSLLALKFDILILDLDTSGLDSLLFPSIVRRIDPHLPIMAVSTRPALHEREIRQKGVFYHPVDPTSGDEMERVMRSWIEYAKTTRIGGESPIAPGNSRGGA